MTSPWLTRIRLLDEDDEEIAKVPKACHHSIFIVVFELERKIAILRTKIGEILIEGQS